MERLLKSVEALKSSGNPQTIEFTLSSTLTRRKETPLTTKEKMHHLRVMVDLLTHSSVKTHTDYSKVFSCVFELLMVTFNDTEADLRLVAEECTNSVIRTVLNEGNGGRALVELYRELRRNGAGRCVRAALSRFSQLVHLIKPQKIRTYAVTVAQCIVQMLSRQEEVVQDSLVKFSPRILQTLVPFLNMQETKGLVKGAVASLTCESATALGRRAGAMVVECVCRNSRKSSLFTTYVFNCILDILVTNEDSVCAHDLLGGLLCMRHVLSVDDIKSVGVNDLVLLYELLVHLVDSPVSSIVAASLEAINQMHLKLPSLNPQVKTCLTDMNGPGPSRRHQLPRLGLNIAGSGRSSLAGSRTDLAAVHMSQLNLEDDEPLFPATQNVQASDGETVERVDDGESTAEDESESSGTDSHRESPDQLVLDPLSSLIDCASPLLSPTVISHCVPVIDNIGEFSDSSPAVFYCGRLLVSRFLLSPEGNSLPDRTVRVSHKSLAMSALTSLVSFVPKVLFQPAFLLPSDVPFIWECMKIDHCDPKIQSCVVQLAAQIINVSSGENENYEDLLSICKDTILSALNDAESITVRDCIDAITTVFEKLIGCDPMFALNLVPKILSLHSDSYWLLKSSLCRFISNLDFVTLRGAEIWHMKSDTLMRLCVECVVDNLLLDADPKVQQSAAQTCVKLVSSLDLREDAMMSQYIPQQMLHDIISNEWLSSPFSRIHNLFVESHKPHSPQIDTNLTHMVALLLTKLIIHENKDSVVSVLCELSREYPPSAFSSSWFSSSADDLGLLQFCVQLVDSPLASSLSQYELCFSLIGRIVAGHISVNCDETGGKQEKWPVLSQAPLAATCSHLLKFCLSILNVYWHVVTDTSPYRTALSQAPNLSPVKHKINKAVAAAAETTSPSQPTSATKNKMLQLHGNPVCMKLYDILVKTYTNYKTNIDEASNDRFCGCLRECMQVVCVLLEAAGQMEASPYLDDLLMFLRALMPLVPEQSVHCVTQMLKCLFGMNLVLTVRSPAASFPPSNVSCQSKEETNVEDVLNVIDRRLEASRNAYSTYGHDVKRHIGWLAARGDKHVLSLLKDSGRKSALTSYIRLFEPIVVQSLRLYTSITCMSLQRSVLCLLCQLVMVRVNYCLLDTDYRFLNFLFQQLETVEEGNLSEASELVCQLFQLLIVLSYEKADNNPIVTVGKILQQCDGLLAADKQEICHQCLLPALHTVVVDLYCVRANCKLESPSELESQQEVVVTMLLKCSHHPRAIEQLTLVLYETRRVDQNKWKTLSLNIVSKLARNIANNQMVICKWSECRAIMNLMSLLAPGSARDPAIVNYLIKYDPSSLCPFYSCVCVWVLLTHFTEENILDYIKDNQLSEECFVRNLLCIVSAVNNIDATGCASMFLALAIGQFLSQDIYPVLCGVFTECIGSMDLCELVATTLQPHLVIAVCSLLCKANAFHTKIWNQLICSSKCIKHIVSCVSAPFWTSSLSSIVHDCVLNNARTMCSLQHETNVGKLIKAVVSDSNISTSFLSVLCAMLDVSSDPTLVLLGLDVWAECRVEDVGIVLPSIVVFIHSPYAIVRHKAANILCAKFTMLTQQLPTSSQYPREKLTQWINHLDHKDRTRHPKLFTSLVQFYQALYPNSPLPSENDIPVGGKFNRLKLVQTIQLGVEYNGLLPPRAVAPALLKCSHEEIEEVLCSQEVDSGILYSCLRHVLENETNCDGQSNESSPEHSNDNSQSSAYKAVKIAILRRVNVHVAGRNRTHSDPLLDSDGRLWCSSGGLVRCVSYMFQHDNLMCGEFEVALSFLLNLLPSCKDYSLVECVQLVEAFCSVLSSPTSADDSSCQSTKIHYKLCNAFFDLLVNRFGGENLEVIASKFEHSFDLAEGMQECTDFLGACRTLSAMLCWVEQDIAKVHWLPQTVVTLISKCVYGLCRLKSLRTVGRVPMCAFKFGWKPVCKVEKGVVVVASVPVHMLHNPAVLKQCVTRLCKVGWTTRTEFEELWMTLLGVLNSTPIGQELMEIPSQETGERIACSALTVRCMTALLLQSLLHPQPGNPLSSTYIMKPRDTNHNAKLTRLSNSINRTYNTMYAHRFKLNTPNLSDDTLGVNIERLSAQNEFGFGQLSVETLWSVTGILAEERTLIKIEGSGKLGGTESMKKSTSSFVLESNSALDVSSCVQTLRELYTHWLAQGCDAVPIPLLSATVQSMLLLSDLFTERSQYEWLRHCCRTVHTERAGEDELILQDLLLAILKATAVLGVDESVEVAKEALVVVESGLQCAQLSVRVQVCHGILYLLQSLTSDEALPFIPPIVDFLSAELDSSLVLSDSLLRSRPRSLDYVLLLWSLSFVLVQTQNDPYSRQNFAPKFTELCQRAFVSLTLPTAVLKAITCGMKSMLVSVTSALPVNEVRKLTSLCLYRPISPLHTISAVQLLSTCLIIVDEPNHSDPQLSAMELLTHLLNRISHGDEVESGCVHVMLPLFLQRHFSPGDVLNRVVSEMLSPTQSRPRLMVSLMRQLFVSLQEREALAVVNDWALLSLPSFLHSNAISHTTALLSCASSNSWIALIFHLVVDRRGPLTKYDEACLQIALKSFQSQLQDKNQMDNLNCILKKAAKRNPFYSSLCCS